MKQSVLINRLLKAVMSVAGARQKPAGTEVFQQPATLRHRRRFLYPTAASLCLLLQSGFYSLAARGQQPIAGESESDPAASIPYKVSDFDLGSTITEVILLLVGLCLATAVIVALLRRRLVGSGMLPDQRAGRIKVLEKKALSTRTATHLLDVDGLRVLVCESAGGTALTILPDATGTVPETKC